MVAESLQRVRTGFVAGIVAAVGNMVAVGFGTAWDCSSAQLLHN